MYHVLTKSINYYYNRLNEREQRRKGPKSELL